MKWRYASGIIRILLMAVTLYTSLVPLLEGIISGRTLHIYIAAPRILIINILILLFLGCYTIYMIGNAIAADFKGNYLKFKALYVISSIPVLAIIILNIIETIEDKAENILANDTTITLFFSFVALFFVAIDFYSLFVEKKTPLSNNEEHRFNTDDYEDIIPE